LLSVKKKKGRSHLSLRKRSAPFLGEGKSLSPLTKDSDLGGEYFHGEDKGGNCKEEALNFAEENRGSREN